MAAKAGESASWIQVSEGLAGKTIDETAFIFEHLLIKETKDAGLILKNIRSSPGKKLYADLVPELKAIIDEAFELIKETAPTILEKKIK